MHKLILWYIYVFFFFSSASLQAAKITYPTGQNSPPSINNVTINTHQWLSNTIVSMPNSNARHMSSEEFLRIFNNGNYNLSINVPQEAANHTRVKANIIITKTDDTQIVIPIIPLFVTQMVGKALQRIDNSPLFLCIHKSVVNDRNNTLTSRLKEFLSTIYRNTNDVINIYPVGSSTFREADAERAMLAYLFSNWSSETVPGAPSISSLNNTPVALIKKITILIHGSAFTCGACSKMLEKITDFYSEKLEIIYKADEYYRDANYRGENGEPSAPDSIRTYAREAHSFYIQFWKGDVKIWKTNTESQTIEEIFSGKNLEIFWSEIDFINHTREFLKYLNDKPNALTQKSIGDNLKNRGLIKYKTYQPYISAILTNKQLNDPQKQEIKNVWRELKNAYPEQYEIFRRLLHN